MCTQADTGAVNTTLTWSGQTLTAQLLQHSLIRLFQNEINMHVKRRTVNTKKVKKKQDSTNLSSIQSNTNRN